MILQTSTKPNILRADCNSSAEVKKSLNSKICDERTPPSIRTSIKRNKVCFNEHVVARNTKHIIDFTPEEVADTWYQKAEYKMMRTEFAVTVRNLSNGEYAGDTEHQCARGLEHKPRVRAYRRRTRRMNSLLTVLDEQERQFCDNNTGSTTTKNDTTTTAMANVYKKACGSSTREASLRGELDAEEASRIRAGKESLTTLVYTAKKLVEEQKASQPKEETTSGKGRIYNLFRKRRGK